MDTLFDKLLEVIYDGMQITFTRKNVAFADDFLIFNKHHPRCKVTIHTNCVPFWVEFDGDEPMRLEDCPPTFWQSIIKNAPFATKK